MLNVVSASAGDFVKKSGCKGLLADFRDFLRLRDHVYTTS
jgi:hypothetical protein